MIELEEVCEFLDGLTASMEAAYSLPTDVQVPSLNGNPNPCRGRRGSGWHALSRYLQGNVTAMAVGVTVTQTVESSDPATDVEEMGQNMAADLTVERVGAMLEDVGVPVAVDRTLTELDNDSPPIVDDATAAPTAAPTQRSCKAGKDGKQGKQGKGAKNTKSAKNTRLENCKNKTGKRTPRTMMNPFEINHPRH